MDLPAPLSCFSRGFARPTSSLANSVIYACANLCRAKNRSGHGWTGRSGCYSENLPRYTLFPDVTEPGVPGYPKLIDIRTVSTYRIPISLVQKFTSTSKFSTSLATYTSARAGGGSL